MSIIWLGLRCSNLLTNLTSKTDIFFATALRCSSWYLFTLIIILCYFLQRFLFEKKPCVTKKRWQKSAVAGEGGSTELFRPNAYIRMKQMFTVHKHFYQYCDVYQLHAVSATGALPQPQSLTDAAVLSPRTPLRVARLPAVSSHSQWY